MLTEVRPGWLVLKVSTFVVKLVRPKNPHGADHSTFICFAPRNHPKIAVSVYVENGRWGSVAAAPIASLITELYLTDTITRPQLVEYVKISKSVTPTMENNFNSRLSVGRVDWWSILIYAILVLAGWLNIYAAVYDEMHSSIFDISQRYGMQLLWMGVSAFLAISILLIDAKYYHILAFPPLLDYYPDFDCGAFRGQGGQRSPIVDHDWPHSSATDRIR